ncbi:MAG: hypothetical protein CSA26_01590 [Desulfobacterales bacterium]|nr:MAG: hypothetical protein CSA26_01590 [Desulfobacterales bacterium]
MPRKQIVLFTVDRQVARYLTESFAKIIGHLVKIHSISMDAAHTIPPCQPDIVFVSGEFLVPKARALFPGIRIISPHRVIVGKNLEKVLLLPKGHNVLVVNSPRKNSEETIEALHDLGLDHLNYIPFFQGCCLDFDNIQTALSPGMMHLCPPEIEHRIDIGPRNVSMSSFLRILEALELDKKYLDEYARKYHRTLMAASRKLSVSHIKTERLRKHEAVIINEYDDGLIYADKNHCISLVNKEAARLLKAPREQIVNKKLHTIMKDFEKLSVILEEDDHSPKSAAIYDIHGEKTVVTRIHVTGDKVNSYIYTLRGIDSIQKLENEVRTKLAQKGYVTKYSFSNIWTRNKKMKKVIEMARGFAATEKNILIMAQTGMGKELFAHAIHQASPVRNGPFVAVNFAGIPDNLVESELFGYDEGAFTGAKKGGKKGLFEQARGGTLFLDEIGDAPLHVQSTLLRVLQEKEVLRVGGTSIIPVEVRIIAATNKNISQAIKEKKFREDLFYRLNTFPIDIPPLQEHKEDILYILTRYLKTRYGISKRISNSAEQCLLSHDWPGNVRELINVAEYVFHASQGARQILPDHLPKAVLVSDSIFSQESDIDLSSCFSRISDKLMHNGLPADMIAQLLRIIKAREGKVCGRNSLQKELSRYQWILSEGKMKKTLKLLKEEEIILVGRTKQGTCITAKGKKYLKYIAHPNCS